MIYNNTKTLLESLMNDKIPTSKICLDMTFGNGNDSYKMLSINKSIQVYGFDIQKICIDNAKKTNNLKVINDSHLNFEKYTNEKIDFAVFNLGYLPGGDKNITTEFLVMERESQQDYFCLTLVFQKILLGINKAQVNSTNKLSNQFFYI